MTMDPKTSTTDRDSHLSEGQIGEPLSARQGGSSVGFIILVLSPLVLLCGVSFPLVMVACAIAVLGFMIWYPVHELNSHRHHH